MPEEATTLPEWLWILIREKLWVCLYMYIICDKIVAIIQKLMEIKQQVIKFRVCTIVCSNLTHQSGTGLVVPHSLGSTSQTPSLYLAACR